MEVVDFLFLSFRTSVKIERILRTFREGSGVLRMVRRGTRCRGSGQSRGCLSVCLLGERSRCRLGV